DTLNWPVRESDNHWVSEVSIRGISRRASHETKCSCRCHTPAIDRTSGQRPSDNPRRSPYEQIARKSKTGLRLGQRRLATLELFSPNCSAQMAILDPNRLAIFPLCTSQDNVLGPNPGPSRCAPLMSRETRLPRLEGRRDRYRFRAKPNPEF